MAKARKTKTSVKKPAENNTMKQGVYISKNNEVRVIKKEHPREQAILQGLLQESKN